MQLHDLEDQMPRATTLIAVSLLFGLTALAGAQVRDQFELVFPAQEMTDPSTLEVTRTGERVVESTVRAGTTLRVVDLEFTSFTWAGEEWRHEASLVLPAVGVPESARGTGVVVAGIPDHADAAAAILGVPALLIRSGNPGPRYGVEREGQLMGWSLEKTMETGDPRWNGYAWLGKVLVRGVTLMASLPETRVTEAVVTGCSKRGMASWIAAAADRRVVGAYPTCWNTGDFRETAKLLLGRLGSDYQQGEAGTKAPAFVSVGEQYLRTLHPEFDRLVALTDPVLFANRIANTPILFAFGTNDPLYHVLSCNLLLPRLEGEKRVALVPNTEHTPDTEPHLASWLMWVAHCLLGRDVPEVSVAHTPTGSGVEVSARIDTTTRLDRVELWWAEDPAGRYHDATWRSTAMIPEGNSYRSLLEPVSATRRVLFVAVWDHDPDAGAGYITSRPIEIQPDQ
jgi:PhoPQ-activated pathogenicity-related protein